MKFSFNFLILLLITLGVNGQNNEINTFRSTNIEKGYPFGKLRPAEDGKNEELIPSSDAGKSQTSQDQSSGVQPLPSPCIGTSPSTKLAHPNEKTKYILCRDEFHYEIFTCPNGGNFNEQANSCDLTVPTVNKCEQEKPCLNDGQCTVLSNSSFKCVCRSDWTGERCETPMNSCVKKPCGPNEECRPLKTIDYEQDYVCVCHGKRGYGLNCQETVPNPCFTLTEQFFPYAFSQRAYIQCDGEMVHFQPCGPSLYWNQEDKICDRKRPAKIDLPALITKYAADKNENQQEREINQEEIISTTTEQTNQQNENGKDNEAVSAFIPARVTDKQQLQANVNNQQGIFGQNAHETKGKTEESPSESNQVRQDVTSRAKQWPNHQTKSTIKQPSSQNIQQQWTPTSTESSSIDSNIDQTNIKQNNQQKNFPQQNQAFGSQQWLNQMPDKHTQNNQPFGSSSQAWQNRPNSQLNANQSPQSIGFPSQTSQNFGSQSQFGQTSQPFGSHPQFGQTSQNFGSHPQSGQTSQNFGSQSQLGQTSQNFGSQPQLGQTSQNFGSQPQLGQTSQNFGSQPQLGQTSQNFGSHPQFGQTSQNFGSKPQLGQTSQPFGSNPQLGQSSQNFGSHPQLGQTSQPFGSHSQFGQTSQNFGSQPQFGQTSQNFGSQPQLGQTSQNFGSQPQLGQTSQPFGSNPQLGQTSQPFGSHPQLGQTSQPFGSQPQFGQTSQNFGSKPQLGQTSQPFGSHPQLGQTSQNFGSHPQLGQTSQNFGSHPQLGQGSPTIQNQGPFQNQNQQSFLGTTPGASNPNHFPTAQNWNTQWNGNQSPQPIGFNSQSSQNFGSQPQSRETSKPVQNEQQFQKRNQQLSIETSASAQSLVRPEGLQMSNTLSSGSQSPKSVNLLPQQQSWQNSQTSQNQQQLTSNNLDELSVDNKNRLNTGIQQNNQMAFEQQNMQNQALGQNQGDNQIRQNFAQPESSLIDIQQPPSNIGQLVAGQPVLNQPSLSSSNFQNGKLQKGFQAQNKQQKFPQQNLAFGSQQWLNQVPEVNTQNNQRFGSSSQSGQGSQTIQNQPSFQNQNQQPLLETTTTAQNVNRFQGQQNQNTPIQDQSQLDQEGSTQVFAFRPKQRQDTSNMPNTQLGFNPTQSSSSNQQFQLQENQQSDSDNSQNSAIRPQNGQMTGTTFESTTIPNQGMPQGFVMQGSRNWQSFRPVESSQQSTSTMPTFPSKSWKSRS